jgi:hypothetical protein
MTPPSVAPGVGWGGNPDRLLSRLAARDLIISARLEPSHDIVNVAASTTAPNAALCQSQALLSTGSFGITGHLSRHLGDEITQSCSRV